MTNELKVNIRLPHTGGPLTYRESVLRPRPPLLTFGSHLSAVDAPSALRDAFVEQARKEANAAKEDLLHAAEQLKDALARSRSPMEWLNEADKCSFDHLAPGCWEVEEEERSISVEDGSTAEYEEKKKKDEEKIEVDTSSSDGDGSEKAPDSRMSPIRSTTGILLAAFTSTKELVMCAMSPCEPKWEQVPEWQLKTAGDESKRRLSECSSSVSEWMRQGAYRELSSGKAADKYAAQQEFSRDTKINVRRRETSANLGHPPSRFERIKTSITSDWVLMKEYAGLFAKGKATNASDDGGAKDDERFAKVRKSWRSPGRGL